MYTRVNGSGAGGIDVQAQHESKPASTKHSDPNPDPAVFVSLDRWFSGRGPDFLGDSVSEHSLSDNPDAYTYLYRHQASTHRDRHWDTAVHQDSDSHTDGRRPLHQYAHSDLSANLNSDFAPAGHSQRKARAAAPHADTCACSRYLGHTHSGRFPATPGPIQQQ